MKEVLRQGEAHLEAGRLREANSAFLDVIRRRPDDVDALDGLARVAAAVGNLEKSAELLGQAIQAAPRRGDLHGRLATTLHQANRFDEALDVARRAASIEPRDPRHRVMAAICLNQMNRVQEARGVLEQALAAAPDDAQANIQKALVDRRLGELERARERIEDVLRRGGLSRIRAQEANRELGFVLDKLGRHDEAFEAFERAGALERQSPEAQRLLAHPWRERIHAMSRGFDPDLLSKWRDLEDDDDRAQPAFLVGFPRSGTTMTEQIMAAHPGIVTGEERPLVERTLGAAQRMAGDHGTVAEQLARLDAAQVRELRTTYRNGVEKLLGEPVGDRVFVDKLPLNILAVGFINFLFPAAKVIVALRDPRDACLSCFMQQFNLNDAMVHFLSLEDTAEFYEAVMGHWMEMRDRLTCDVLEVRYEDTVRDLESQARRLLEFLEAPWDDAVLRFHEVARERYINTPSYAAVTEKVHTRATERWRKYAEKVEPVTDRLRPFIHEFGYAESARGGG